MEIYSDKIIINGQVFVPYIDRKTIKAIIKKIANRINKDYRIKNPVFVIILKGAIFFATDLLKLIKFDCRVETYRVKSYGMKMTGSNNIELPNPEFEINNRDIIIVEDIVDSGNTLTKLKDSFTKLEPASLEITSLLIKKENTELNLNIKYPGINIPSKFVVGYGLDYAEQGRHLPDIYIQI